MMLILKKNIGCLIKFKKDKSHGTIHKEIHKIVGVQKMWGYDKDGMYVPNCVGYRVVLANGSDDFGRCANVDEVTILK